MNIFRYFLYFLFVTTCYASFAQQQGQVNFSIRIGDFQSVSVTETTESKQHLVKVLGTSAYELSVDFDSTDSLHAEDYLAQEKEHYYKDTQRIAAQRGIEITHTPERQKLENSEVVYYNVIPI